MRELSAITVHGRFQPPLHINHWEYIRQGFERAEHVVLLITNPFLDEAFDSSASWRNDPTNNPFSYEERIQMFRDFFTAMNIAPDRYTFRPFNIKETTALAELDPKVPNLVNVYSKWSAKKADAFKSNGLEVIQLDQAKSKPVTGTIVREIIKNTTDQSVLSELLVEAGFMPEAVPGLMKVLAKR